MSDRGIPASYRQMHGFASHTFSLVNPKNERFWVKFHFESQQGIRNYEPNDQGEWAEQPTCGEPPLIVIFSHPFEIKSKP